MFSLAISWYLNLIIILYLEPINSNHNGPNWRLGCFAFFTSHSIADIKLILQQVIYYLSNGKVSMNALECNSRDHFEKNLCKEFNAVYTPPYKCELNRPKICTHKFVNNNEYEKKRKKRCWVGLDWPFILAYAGQANE